MLNEPSGLRSQPSNAGTTSWPVAYRVWARAGVIGASKPSTRARSAGFRLRALGFWKCSPRKPKSRKSTAQGLLLLILARPICLQAIAFGDLRFELVVAHVVVGEPVSRHVVGGAV